MSALRRDNLKRLESQLASDRMLGLAGSGIAIASIGFGLYMNTRGPAPGGFGTSHDFTVFAQLAPHAPRESTRQAARPARADDALDMTATATIPKPPQGPATSAESGVIPSVTLETASADAATIVVDGEVRTIRIGDDVPGAGQVLEIRAGGRPSVKTSRGLIVSAAE